VTAVSAVLPDAEDVEVCELAVSDQDPSLDVYRSRGAWRDRRGVNNLTISVRARDHLPDVGLVVTCQDEKSQHKNKS